MIVALDAGSPGPREAEHLLHEVLGLLPDDVPAPQTACTHAVGTGGPHHALTLTWDGGRYLPDVPATLAGAPVLADAGVVMSGTEATGVPRIDGPPHHVDGAQAALDERSQMAGGRLVRFVGQANLVGRLTVVDVVASSAVDDVEGLSGVEVRHDSVVDTLGWVRPTWRAGRVVLLVQAAAGGVLVPFEVEQQVSCCTHH